MKLHPSRVASETRRGAALLLAFLVLIVIVMITYQVTRTTGNDQIETQRHLVFTSMDLAIESVFQQVEEDLAADAAAAEEGGEEGAIDPGALGDPGSEGETGGDPAAGGEEEGATDSMMDEWFTPSTTVVADRDLRIVIVDEDRKFNVLGLLAEDEEEADEALAIVTRILDLCREGTEADIDPGEAADMARDMLDHLRERGNSILPRAALLSDGEEVDELAPGMPMTMREFIALESFEDHHFRDFFDQDGERVHSIGAYLTIWTSPVTGADPTPTGGYSVNVNTAPLAVMAGLFDSREVNGRSWDQVLLYRNEAEEQSAEEEAVEPALDEFGNEILPLKIFDSLEELDEISDFENMDAEIKPLVLDRLKVESSVFSVYVTAREPTGADTEQRLDFESHYQREQYERTGRFLVRTVRRVYWRRTDEEGETTLVPLLNWEVLDYAPLEVRDFKEDDGPY